MVNSAQTILDGMICGKPGCQCRVSARKGHGLTHCPAHDDEHPSLSVSQRDGKVLIKCHAGCVQPEVIEALITEGLWAGREPGAIERARLTSVPGHPRADSSLRAQAARSSGPPQGVAMVSAGVQAGAAVVPHLTRYRIRDLAGNVVAVHVRRDVADGKHLSWELPDGLPGLGGLRTTSLPLYGIHELGDRLAVILVEGEKCRDALASLGLPAVGTVTGAATIPADPVLAQLSGRKVYLWPDADLPGQEHMRRIAERLAGLGCDIIKRVRWDRAPVGGDAADFVAQGGTQRDVARLLVAATSWSDDDAGPDQDPTDPGAGMRPVLTRLDDVTPETVRWLWPGRIPRGKLTILDGDPGLGKSTVLLDLAARLTAGTPMPDGARAELTGPASILILSAEDGLGDTVRPRLEAAGADLKRVVSLQLADRHGERLLDLSSDLAHLQAVVVQEQVALIIVDPLVAYLGNGVDAYRDQDIRRVLAPLARLAETTGAAIIGVRHLTKGGGTNAKYRGGGSIGIIGAARSGLLVAADPEDDERRILATIKSNLAAPMPALAYRLESAGEHGVRIRWEGVTKHTAAQLLAEPREPEEPSALEEAVELLQTILAGGPVPAKEVKAQAREAGVSERTVNRAKARLAICTNRDGFGTGGAWLWSLP